MNYHEISTIDTKRGVATFRHKNCLNEMIMERRISNKNEEEVLKALGSGGSEVESRSMAAIPFKEARLCINCEHVVRNLVCPTCGSKSHIILGNVLGLIK